MLACGIGVGETLIGFGVYCVLNVDLGDYFWVRRLHVDLFVCYVCFVRVVHGVFCILFVSLWVFTLWDFAFSGAFGF